MTGPVVSRALAVADLADAYRIRRVVFVEEQGVPSELERDSRDAEADHLIARLDGSAVGAVRLVVEPPGFEQIDPAYGPVAHLGRLAVHTAARRQGIGALLVGAVEDRARTAGLRAVYLGAQTHAMGFYEALGYTPFGLEFDDAGLPHRHMLRVL